MKKDKIIFELYKALDDIDTTGDIYKSNYKARCNHIDKILNKVVALIEPDFITKLYDKYYNKSEDILNPFFSKAEKPKLDKKFWKEFEDTGTKLVIEDNVEEE